MNQNASICADWSSDYDYSYILKRGRERGKLAISSVTKTEATSPELIAYAGTKIFDKDE